MEKEKLAALVRDYLLPSVPGQTLLRVIEAHGDENVRAFQITSILQENPIYSHILLTQGFLSQKITQWTEEDPKQEDKERIFTKRVLSLLGKGPVRNLVTCVRIARATGTGMPRKKGERLTIQPKQMIPSAILAEEYCEENKWVHPEMSFRAGLHYDWLSALLEAKRAPKDAKSVLDDAFKEGFKTAQYAYEIGSLLKSVEHNRFVFAAGLVLPLGKALMALSFPKGSGESWASFIADCEKKFGPKKKDAEEALQKKRFQIRHIELTSLYVISMGFLGPIEPAIRFSQEPWLIQDLDPNLYALAMILSIASTLASLPPPKGDRPLILKKFQKDWLKKSGVSDDSLKKALLSIKPAGGKG